MAARKGETYMAKVLCGLDRLELADSLLRGRRVGLMTNPTGVDQSLRSAISILHERYQLTALFACEHGVRGNLQAGDHLETYVDAETGVTVHSLYGESQRMTAEMLAQFDVFVFDMQDVGARFYTYLYSLAYAMEDCAMAGKSVIVLDRPNPLGGETVQGTLLDERFASFVGLYAMPSRYGLTIGEYALWLKEYRRLDLELTVIPLAGWARWMYRPDTGIPWVAPSPNIPTATTALLFSGTCMFEGTNLSEGRGTTQPFEQIGAPWLDGAALEAGMNAMALPGLRFRRVYFTPMFSKHQGKLCGGVQLHVTDPRAANPFAASLYMLAAIGALHPEKLAFRPREQVAQMKIELLLGTDAIGDGKLDVEALMAEHAPKVRGFQEQTMVYRLYE